MRRRKKQRRTRRRKKVLKRLTISEPSNHVRGKKKKKKKVQTTYVRETSPVTHTRWRNTKRHPVTGRWHVPGRDLFWPCCHVTPARTGGWLKTGTGGTKAWFPLTSPPLLWFPVRSPGENKSVLWKIQSVMTIPFLWARHWTMTARHEPKRKARLIFSPLTEEEEMS